MAPSPCSSPSPWDRALATLLDRTGLPAATGLVLAASLSRVAALAPMVLLPPARSDGLSAPPGAPAARAS